MARLILTGDSARGLEFVPRAQWELGQMKRNGADSGSKSVSLSKDVLVRIVLDKHAGDKVYIHASTCPSIPFSGFVDAFMTPDLTADEAASSLFGGPALATASAQVTAELRDVVVPPATSPSPQFYGVRVVAPLLDPVPPATTVPPVGLALTTKLPLDPGSAERDFDAQGNDLGTYSATVTTSDWKRIFNKYPASCFTGLLRKIWQCSAQRMILKAIAGDTYISWDTANIGIDFKFGNSYGVVVNAGVHYLIRISYTDIFYVPAEFCTKTYLIDGVKTGITQLISVSNEKAVKIGSVPNIGSSISGSGEIGWAFSYTEAKASIVTLSSKLSGVQTYQATILSTATFGFDLVTGEPNAATVVKGATQILWGPRFMCDPAFESFYYESLPDFGLINVPQYGVAYPDVKPRMHHQSLDFGPGRPYPSFRPKPVEYAGGASAPIYAYYKPSGELQLWNYNFVDNDHDMPADTYYFSDSAGESYHSNKPTTTTTKKTKSYVEIVYDTASYGSEGRTLCGVGIRGAFPPGVWILGADAMEIYISGMRNAMNYAETMTVYGGTASGWDWPGSWLQASRLTILGPSAYPVQSVRFTMDNNRYESLLPCDPSGGGYPYDDPSVGNYYGGGYVGGSFYAAGSIFEPVTFSLSSVTNISAVVDEFGRRVSYDSSITFPIGDREAALVYTRQEFFEFKTSDGTFMTTVDEKLETLFLYGHHDPLVLDHVPFSANRLMIRTHPYKQDLSFRSTQAAFNPDNMTHTESPGVYAPNYVRINGAKYGVEGALFGWLGVV